MRTIHPIIQATAIFIFLLAASCDQSGGGLAPADNSGDGPRPVFDFDHKPFAEIPFPNNLATIYDDSMPTGRRINISKIAPTSLERDLREKAIDLDGFGIFQPISIPFDGPLDLENIIERHHDANLEPSNDAIYLLNIDPKSPKFGTAIPLDVGQGNFPVLMQAVPGDPYTEERGLCVDEAWTQDNYWIPLTSNGEPPYTREESTGFFNYCDPVWRNEIRDAHYDGSNLLFESHDETADDIDRDGDGVIDVPNTLEKDDDVWRELITFYEKQSDTLIAKPLLPLEEETTYAVVLTKRLLGEAGAGNPIRSPFNTINHMKQTEELEPLKKVLSQGFTMEGDSSQSVVSLSIDDVAFTWSYTTQTVTKDLVALRKGLYGVGPFGWLAEQFPAHIQSDRLTLLEEDLPETDIDERNQYLLPIDNLQQVLEIAGNMLLSEIVSPEHADESVTYMVQTMNSISHILSGRFDVPYFLADQDGYNSETYAGDNEESFHINSKTGEAHVGHDEVTWWCIVPRETENYKQPFPVNIYSHGYSTNRFEAIGFASLMAYYGIATCGIDSVGHGLVIPPQFLEDPVVLGLLDSLKIRPAIQSLSTGRARDLNNDGVPDSGGDFWTADTFHTRDIVRQSVIDTMQFIRIMRSFDGSATWPEGSFEDQSKYFAGIDAPSIAGDFDGNGRPDFGGPNQDYYPWGQSLGGFITALLSATDPAVTAAAPVAGGAGLIDVGLRTIQEGVIQAVFLSFMGPFVFAQPVAGTDQLSFGFIVPDNTRWWGSNDGVHDYFMRDFARSEADSDNPAIPGDRVVVVNEISDDEWFCVLDDNLVCRVGYAADALDGVEKRHALGMPDEWYFRGVEEIVPERDGEQRFITLTEEEIAALGEEERRLYNLRSELQWIPDASKMGDLLRIELRAKDGTVKEVIDTWAQNMDVAEGEPFPGSFYQGFFYKPGDRLVSPADGLGKVRQSPEFRRLMNISSMILEPADPVAYMRYQFERPFDFSDVPMDAALYEYRKQRDPDWTPHVNNLVIPTNGDMNVPVAVEINVARAAGMIEMFETRAEWDDLFCEGGSYSENDLLIRSKSLEAIEGLNYFDNTCFNEPRSINFDADNLDNGLDIFGAPSPATPLRATVESRPWDVTESRKDREPTFEKLTDDGDGMWSSPYGVSAMRIPYLEMEGAHGFVVPAPYKQYDIDQHMINMVGRYFQTHGKELWDHRCLADSSCEFFNEDHYVQPYED